MALIKCTHCGKETNNNRGKCLLCGKEISEELRFKEETAVKEKVKLDKTSVKENPENDTKNCPFCFEEIKKQAIKCKHCQEKLTDVKDIQDDIQENIAKDIKLAHREMEQEDKSEETIARLAAQKGCYNIIKGFLIVFVPAMIILFFYIKSVEDNACECVEAYDKMPVNAAADKMWDSCNRQWRREAEEDWLKNNPNHSSFEYAQKWGSHYNDGMVNAYLEKECSR